MKNRTHSRIGAAVLAGLVAVVPVAGAVAVASPAAAQPSVVFLDEDGNEVEPVEADGPVSPEIQPLDEVAAPEAEPISEPDADVVPEPEIAPISAEMDYGFPWILVGYLGLSAVVTVGGVIYVRRSQQNRR